MKTVVLSGGDAAKLASSILRRAPLNTLGPPPNRRCPERRYTLIRDNTNVVYAAVCNAGHVRCIGFMHSYLGEQELSQLSDNVGSSPPASTPYDQTKN